MTQIVIERDIMVAMADGTRLATDVYRVEGRGPLPAILLRTPYNKDDLQRAAYASNPDHLALVEAGYVVVKQDCRGTFRSEGAFEAMETDQQDAADTIAWLRQQPWCNGQIGMYGMSFIGLTQMQAVASGAEGLCAVAPAVTSASPYFAPWYSIGGAFSLDTALMWSYRMAIVSAQRAGDRVAAEEKLQLARAFADSRTTVERLPISDHPLLTAHGPHYATWLAHPTYDDLWRERAVDPDLVDVAALHIGGWFDFFNGATLDAFTSWRDAALHRGEPSRQRLLMGPWSHRNTQGLYPERDFGVHAMLAAQGMQARHIALYDTALKDAEPAPGSTPVRIFVMGADVWSDESDWPPPDVREHSYYLSSKQGANSSAGDGALTLAMPEEASESVYLYDPLRPVPTVGGQIHFPHDGQRDGPVDLAPLEGRSDVLVYSTEALAQPVTVIGRIGVELFISSDAPDTDFTATLVDVHPDGRAQFLTEGILRVRYRNSLAEPELMQPGTIYRIQIDLQGTANVFLPGHRIRLHVSSSNFPRFDRNTNTGGVIADDSAADARVAINRVYAGAERPSRLVLPVRKVAPTAGT